MNNIAKIISVKKSVMPIINEVTLGFYGTDDDEKLNILTSELSENGYAIGSEMTLSDLDILHSSEEVTKAFIHGIRLLGYSDASVRGLSQKLRSKGYEKEIAERAAAALEEHGYIREREVVMRKGDRIAEVKLRGKRRVAEELLTAGYKREYVSEWMKTTTIDFSAVCARVITKKGGIPESADRDGRRKLLSYLYRQGFSSDDVRGAIEIL